VKSNQSPLGRVITSVSAQAISLLVSFVLGFIVPKFIDEYQYAYWHIFLLYLGYVGLMHFGMIDGIVLRYSQYDYEELDKERLRSQFVILLCTTTAIAVSVCVLSQLMLSGESRTIAVLVACGIITKNLVTYDSYILQITNRITQYAALLITQRLGYGIFAIALLAAGVNRFEWYCIADLAGDCAGLLLAKFLNRGLHLGRCIHVREAVREWKINVFSGMSVLLANLSASLILGGAKMIIQWRWGELIFGKIAFSFSIANLYLAFISAVSVVLFPHLKRKELNQLPNLYGRLRSWMTPMLVAAMILYFPGCSIIERFLPAYSQSLTYLGILLPIIIFTSKVNLLTNNYMKTYRKERSMLIVNLVSGLLSIVMVVFCAYALNNLRAVLISIVCAIVIYSLLSEVVVFRVMGISFYREIVWEAIMTTVFILCVNTMNRWTACAMYAIALLIYLLCHRVKKATRI